MSEDIIKVEVRYPVSYVQVCLDTMSQFSKEAILYCMDAAALEEDEIDFVLPHIKTLQVLSLEQAMKEFAIKLTHKMEWENGERVFRFHADVSEFRKFLEENQ